VRVSCGESTRSRTSGRAARIAATPLRPAEAAVTSPSRASPFRRRATASPRTTRSSSCIAASPARRAQTCAFETTRSVPGRGLPLIRTPPTATLIPLIWGLGVPGGTRTTTGAAGLSPDGIGSPRRAAAVAPSKAASPGSRSDAARHSTPSVSGSSAGTRTPRNGARAARPRRTSGVTPSARASFTVNGREARDGGRAIRGVGMRGASRQSRARGRLESRTCGQRGRPAPWVRCEG
jgi:hypothetical protein